MRPHPLLAFSLALTLLTTPLAATDYGFTLLHAAGQPAPGVERNAFTGFRPPYLDELGRVLFHASASGDSFVNAVWKHEESTTDLFYTEFAPIPEIGGHYLYDGIPHFGTGANVMFHNDPEFFAQWPDFVLYDGSGFALVPADQTPKTDPGYRSTYASNGERLLVLGHLNPPDPFSSSTDYFVHLFDTTGTEVVLNPGDTFSDRNGIPFEIIGGPARHPAIGSGGDIAFWATGAEVTEGPRRLTQAILHRAPGGALQAATDTTVSGGSITVEALEVGPGGHVVFRGKLPLHPTTTIFRQADTGGFRVVAKVGDPTPGEGSATFASLGRFQVAANGSIVFWGTDSDGKDGLWIQYQDPEITTGFRTLDKVVVEGDTAPDGTAFHSLSGGFANGKNQVIFNAVRFVPPDGFQRSSLWLASYDEMEAGWVPAKIVEQFDTPLPLPDGRTALAATGGNPFPWNFSLDGATFNGNTVRGGFNSAGDIALVLPYRDPDTAVTVDALWIARPQGIIVNTLTDLPDTDHGDGRADTGQPEIAGRPACSLRAAIEEANALGGAQTIRFDIDPALAVTGDTAEVGELQIHITSPLPEITADITFDGLSQPADTTPTLIGATLPGDTPGLETTASNTTVTGIQVREFPGHGIANAAGQLTVVGCSIQQNRGSGVFTRGDAAFAGCSVSGNHGWGIESAADGLEFDREPGTHTTVSTNLTGGVLHFGRSLHIGNLHTVRNGSTPEGHGLFAPNADTTAENHLVATENAGHGAFLGSLDADGGRLTFQFRSNRGSGLVVTGVLNLEQGLLATANHRWGLELSGTSAVINADQTSNRSLVSGNLTGGILAATPRFELNNATVRSNGVPGVRGVGIDASAGHVVLDDGDVSSNHGDGIRAGSAKLDGCRVKSNAGHGLTACPGPLDIADTAFVRNTLSGIHLCAAASGKPSRLSNVTATRNGRHGVETHSTDTLVVDGCLFTRNTQLGLANLSGATGNVTANGNDWGAGDGPSGDGPGTGDGVSPGVTVNSWLAPAGPWSLAFDPDAFIYPGETARVPVIVRGGPDTPDDATATATVTMTHPDGTTATMQQDITPGDVLWLETQSSPGATPGVGEPFDVEVEIEFSDPSNENGLVLHDITIEIEGDDPRPTRAEIKPANPGLTRDQVIKLGAILFDQNDRRIPDARRPASGLSWQATGAGTVDNDGTFTAGSTPGQAELEFKFADDTIGTTTATVGDDTPFPAVDLTIDINSTLSLFNYKQEAAVGEFVLSTSTDGQTWDPVFDWTSRGEPRIITLPAPAEDTFLIRAERPSF